MLASNYLYKSDSWTTHASNIFRVSQTSLRSTETIFAEPCEAMKSGRVIVISPLGMRKCFAQDNKRYKNYCRPLSGLLSNRITDLDGLSE